MEVKGLDETKVLEFMGFRIDLRNDEGSVVSSEGIRMVDFIS